MPGFNFLKRMVPRSIRRAIKDITGIAALQERIHQLETRLHQQDERIGQLEVCVQAPRDNVIQENYERWQNWDWGQRGEEWTVSGEWKQSLIDDVILRYLERGDTVLEVGPGGGRWTETLQKMAGRLVLVDLSDKCIEICKDRFSQCDNIEFYVNDGQNLNFIQDETVDFIWSFNVFVHINPHDIEKYLMEFRRILRKGGRGIIHHAKEGGMHGGWRSTMTAELFLAMLDRQSLKLVDQFDAWGAKGEFNVRGHHDVLTVFEK